MEGRWSSRQHLVSCFRSADLPVPDQAEENACRQGQEERGGAGEDDAVEAEGFTQDKKQAKAQFLIENAESREIPRDLDKKCDYWTTKFEKTDNEK